MSEARELFERVAAVARKYSVEMGEGVASMHSVLAADIGIALAAEPGAVPELPEWLELDEHEDWRVTFEGGHRFWIDPSLPPDDLDRIAEACTKLAARERARRAGS